MSRDLLFEIGVEEIPSAALYAAITQLKKDAEKALAEERLGYDTLETFGGPRRLVVRVTQLAEGQEDRTLRVKGPSVKAAFDADGNPTRAAEGFARSRGIDVGDLVREDEGGGEYVFAVVDEVGRSTLEVLPDVLAQLAANLNWPKSQRWGNGTARFIRPVRTLVALFGEEVVPVQFAGLTADRFTEGHRFLAADRSVRIASAQSYDEAARRGMFVYDQEARATLVREGIEAIEAQHGVRAVVPEKTFSEVVNLVEWPTATVGHFDEEFLEVPREVIETAMTKHQRYFPLEGADGNLTNMFIVVHNGDSARSAEIATGHERVIRARLADATFFYREDLAINMEEWVAKLDSITFQEKLGTSGAKVVRNERLAEALAQMHGADAGETAEAVRASHLAKADLVSHAVVEFPVLQGVMGRYYALAAGETEPVAQAILEHYQPRFAGDAVPSTVAGKLTSVADKLDTMVGIFGIGMAPTGSADPYALRRGALGILNTIIDGLDITLDDSIALGLEGYRESHTFDTETVGTAIKAFVVGRFEGLAKDRGHAYDTVSAVLAVAADDPADAIKRCDALTSFRAGSNAMDDLSTAFTRAKNLSKPELGSTADPALMGAEEAVLADALTEAEQAVAASYDVCDYDAVLGVLAGLRVPIDAFFENVLVMDEDNAVRENRLRLLNRFVALFARFADFSALSE